MIIYITSFPDQQNKILNGRYSSTGRALDCGSNGYRFKSYYLPIILQKEELDLKSSFLYEGYKWEYSIDLIFDIENTILNKNNNLLCLYYGNLLTKVLSIFRKTTSFPDNLNYIYNWYNLYYINCILNKNLTDKNNKNLYEKHNLIVINFKSKQLRINILSTKNKILNLSVGRVLATLKIKEKSKKKTNKGERLLLEYLNNFFVKTIKLYGISRLSILKIVNGRIKTKLSNSLLKKLNQTFKITKIVYDYKISNNFLKLKKIRSIKKRIKKKIIKQENTINL